MKNTPSLHANFDLDKYLNRIIPPSPLYLLPSPISRFLGYRKTPKPDVGNLLIAFWALVGTFCGLLVVGAIFRYSPWIQEHHPPVLIASLGAAAVLEFNAIAAPMGQPRNAILGHLLSATVGICIARVFEHSPTYDAHRWLAAPLACGIASALMTLTNTVHPPGGATAVLAVADPTTIALGWLLLPLVLISCLLMLSVALVINNIQRHYPVWWWTSQETGTVWKRRKQVKVMDVESYNRSNPHTLVESRRGSDPVAIPDLHSAVVLLGDGSISIPLGIEVDGRERAVLVTLLAKLQERQLKGPLSEKRWSAPPIQLG